LTARRRPVGWTQCAGIDPASALADLERLLAAFSAMRDSMARPLTPSDVQAALDQQRAMARRYGTPKDIVAEGFRRNLTRRGFEGRLAKASDANPCLRVTRVEGATHAMVAERPGEIARLITHFATPPTA